MASNKTCFLRAVLAFALLCAGCALAQAEEPAAKVEPDFGVKEVVVRCTVCKGTGKLVLTPPDKGQYRGKIDAKSHWDIRKACPFCEGNGKVKVYRTRVLPNAELKAIPPCHKCGWAGASAYRKCGSTGLVTCRHSKCENGWIIEKPVQEFRRTTNVKPPKVFACPECGGTGKAICPECNGRRGAMCNKCQGIGKELK